VVLFQNLSTYFVAGVGGNIKLVVREISSMEIYIHVDPELLRGMILIAPLLLKRR